MFDLSTFEQHLLQREALKLIYQLQRDSIESRGRKTDRYDPNFAFTRVKTDPVCHKSDCHIDKHILEPLKMIVDGHYGYKCLES